MILLLGYVPGMAQMSGTYTVDPSIPISDRNYHSIAAAFGDLQSGNRNDGGIPQGPGVAQSVVVDLMSDVIYNEQIRISSINGVSASRSITIQGNDALLSKRVSNDTAKFVMLFDQASYINVVNLRVELLDDTSGHNIRIAHGSHHIAINGCTFSQPEVETTFFANAFVGLYNWSSYHQSKPYGFPGRDISISGCKTDSSGLGVYSGFSALVEDKNNGDLNISITDNDLSNFCSEGIVLFNVGNAVIRNNRIHDNSNGKVYTFSFGIRTTLPKTGTVTIENNDIYNINLVKSYEIHGIHVMKDQMSATKSGRVRVNGNSINVNGRLNSGFLHGIHVEFHTNISDVADISQNTINLNTNHAQGIWLANTGRGLIDTVKIHRNMLKIGQSAGDGTSIGINLSYRFCEQKFWSLVYNNILQMTNVYDNIGVYVQNANDGEVRFFHNTITATTFQNPPLKTKVIMIKSNGRTAFNNNIFYSDIDGSMTLFQMTTKREWVNSDNNCYYMRQVRSVRWMDYDWTGQNQQDYIYWEVFKDSIGGAKDVNMYPDFEDPENGKFTPYNSFIDNIGQRIYGISEDFYGKQRSLTNPDPGAIEFFGLGLQRHDVNSLRIFPNPSQSYIRISHPIGVQIESFRIVDTRGVLVDLSNLLETQNESTLNIETFARGAYFVTLTDSKGKMYQGRFVKY